MNLWSGNGLIFILLNYPFSFCGLPCTGKSDEWPNFDTGLFLEGLLPEVGPAVGGIRTDLYFQPDPTFPNLSKLIAFWCSGDSFLFFTKKEKSFKIFVRLG